MKKPVSRSLMVLALLGLLAAVGCRRPDPARRLILTGSSTIAPVAAELGKRFEAKHPGIRIDVQSGGSSRGVEDARQGRAQLGMVSRALKAEESDLVAYTFAHDGIGIIVHRDNPIADLSRDQVIAIYTGQTIQWAQFAMPGGGIVVVNKAEGRSTLELFLAHFGLRADQVRAAIVIGDNEQGIKTVAGNPDAIGYVSIGSAEAAIAAGVAIRLVSVEGRVASRQAVKDGTAPMARPLNFVTRGEPSALAQELLDFVRSPDAAATIEQAGFVPGR